LIPLFFNISGGEIFIILLVVFIIFGPDKIPEIARWMGKGLNEVKKATSEIREEISRETKDIRETAGKIKEDIKKETDGLKDFTGKTSNAPKEKGAEYPYNLEPETENEDKTHQKTE